MQTPHEDLGVFFLSLKGGFNSVLDSNLYLGFCFTFSVNPMPTKTYYHG